MNATSIAAPPEDGPALRALLIERARDMNRRDINVNRAGNLSVRCRRGAVPGLLITPSGMDYDTLAPADLVFIRAADGASSGTRTPSSEWRIHHDVLRARAEFGAVVHTHSPAATALACQETGIPPFHYMVAAAGGRDIRCAPYATFGTQALSDHVVAALAGRRACLLSHHGVVACGGTLDEALRLALEVEHLARIYLLARQLGEPPLLPDDEMARVQQRFQTYGQPPASR